MRGVVALATVVLVTLSACSSDGGSQTQQLALLFVQDARAATLDTTQGTLTMTDSSPSVTYFSSRPQRVAGQMSLASLINNWGRFFGNDPPNAGIQSLASVDGARPAVVELLQAPSYDGGTLTYRVRPIDFPASAPQRVSLRDVSLFIDGGLAGGDALSSGAVASQCSEWDSICPPPGSTTVPGAQAENNCTPMDPRCGAISNSGEAVSCEMDPYECENYLTVVIQGNGAGTVTSSPAGIDCSSTCTFENFKGGEQVTLTAAAASGSTFVGWSGDNCSGTGQCTVKIGYPTTALTATFNAG